MTLTRVIYKDQQSAEEMQGLPDWVVISITDPDWHPANLQAGWHDILRLEFHDIDLYTEPYVLFNQQQAVEIIQFVTNCHDAGVNGVVVHCKAGISRSAAVAKWIAGQYNLAFSDGYTTMPDLLIGLTEYFVLYNTERPHQSLGYETPDQVYRTASGGGARIVDKYNSEKEKTHPEIETKKETENRGSAVPLHMKGYPLKLDALVS